MGGKSLTLEELINTVFVGFKHLLVIVCVFGILVFFKHFQVLGPLGVEDVELGANELLKMQNFVYAYEV